MPRGRKRGNPLALTSIRTARGPAGEVLAYEAIAGKINGYKVRKRFGVARYGSEKKARAAAELWHKRERGQLLRDRSSVIVFDDETRAECLTALRLLDGRSASIVEAVQVYLSVCPKSVKPWTFRQAAEAFLSDLSQRNCRPWTLARSGTFLRMAYRIFGDRELDLITPDDLARWLKTKRLEPTTYRHYRARLCALFNFALKHERCSNNPALKLPKPQPNDLPPEILSAPQAQGLLDAASPRIVPYLALGLFAGLRPSEAARLPREAIRDGKILIEGNRTKSRQRRVVEVQANLAAWLEAAPPEAWNGRRYEAAQELAQTAKLKSGVRFGQSALRHSFASHHLALYNDPARTAMECGHNQTMLFRHYRELVSREQAESYFSVTPRSALF